MCGKSIFCEYFSVYQVNVCQYFFRRHSKGKGPSIKSEFSTPSFPLSRLFYGFVHSKWGFVQNLSPHPLPPFKSLDVLYEWPQKLFFNKLRPLQKHFLKFLSFPAVKAVSRQKLIQFHIKSFKNFLWIISILLYTDQSEIKLLNLFVLKCQRQDKEQTREKRKTKLIKFCT